MTECISLKIFKKNSDLNLNKSQILPLSQVNETLQKFEIQLMKKFWEDISTMTIEEKHDYSIGFYKNIFRGRSFYHNSLVDEYYDFFKETLYPFTLRNNKLEIIQLGNFLDNNIQFLLAPFKGYYDAIGMEDKIEQGRLYEEFGVELLIPSFDTLLLYLEWIYNKKLSIKVINGPFLPYLFVDVDKRMTHSTIFNKFLVVDFENDERSVFASVIYANPLFKCLLNKNNPFIEFISQNLNLISESIKLLIKEFFSMIRSTNYPPAIGFDLNREYSEIISQINSNYNTNFDTSFLLY